MKPSSATFKSLLLPAFLLGTAILPLPAEPPPNPQAPGRLTGVGFVKASRDPFAEPDPSEVDTYVGVDPFAEAASTDVEPKPPELVRIQVEYIELSHKTLSKLLFLADPDATNGTALREKLQAMVEKDEAEVLDTQLLVCRSANKATTESIHEFIYPTEYEPPSLGCGGSSSPSSTVAGEYPLPTAFDTRNLGSSLEVEPTIDEDGKLINLRFVPELVWHTGNTSHLDRKNALGHIYKLEMPDFYAVQLNTSVTCVAGQYLMAGVLSPKDSKGDTDMTRKVMVFVKCDILTVK